MYSAAAAEYLTSTAALAAVLFTLAPTTASAQVNMLPDELRGIDVSEHLGALVPLDATFRNHHGDVVRLGQLLDGRRPVVVQLAYFRCPVLCSMVTNAMVQALRANEWTVGDQFQVLTVSIDPTDSPLDATRKRDSTLAQYRRLQADNGWDFLTGDSANIERVARAVGVFYRYDARQNQYAHPAVIMLLTPEGRIARYLYGIQFDPRDVRIGLLEASRGHSISTVERILLFCYHYDPQGRRYAVVATRVMQFGGAVTVVAIVGLIGGLLVRERMRARRAASSVVVADGPSSPSASSGDLQR